MSPIADNVAITAGVGTSIATDDISSVQYQRVKMGVGADGKYSELQPCTVGGVDSSTVDTTIASSSAILFGVTFFTGQAAGSGLVHVRDSTSSSTGASIAGFWFSTGAGAARSGSCWFGPQGLKLDRGIRIVSSSTLDSIVKVFYISPA